MALAPKTRTLLVQVGSFVLAGVLLYLALRGVDFGEVKAALVAANYTWLLPLAFVTLFSHWLRAWRWQALLEALPPKKPGGPPPRVSVKTAFYSVMIGYMVNYAAPRLGEVARSANVASQSDIRLSGVFGTVVAERLFDMIVMALGLLSVFVLLADQLGTLDTLFVTPLVEQLGRLPALGLAGLVVALIIGLFLLYRAVLRREDSLARRLWAERVQPVLASFTEGMMTLLRTPRRGVLLVSTLGIWFCYLLMAYLPLVMLGMTDAFGLGLLDGWVIMLLGAIGVVIPSPGGTGSYHFITVQVLVYLFAVTQSAAATYAVLTHGAQLVLYVAVGALCLLLQGSSFRSLKETTQAAQETADASAPLETRHDDATP